MRGTTCRKTWLALWGNGDHGRLGMEGSRLIPSVSSWPSFFHPLQQVACGGAHTVVLDNNGSIFAAGLDKDGQCSLPKDDGCESSKRRNWKGMSCSGKDEMPRFVGIAAGHHHTLAVDEHGSVWSCGKNDSGQCGHGVGSPKNVWELTRIEALKDRNIVQVSTGADHSFALSDDGRLYAWGCTQHGRLGIGNVTWKASHVESTPRMLRDLSDVRIASVSAGHLASACVDATGQAYTFGYGRHWQLGRGDETGTWTPYPVRDLHSVSMISMGGIHAAAINSYGSLLVWGTNECGALGLGPDGPPTAKTPTVCEVDGTRFSSVSCGWKHTAALSEHGVLYTWGWGGFLGSSSTEEGSTGGQLGHGHISDQWNPARVFALFGPEEEENHQWRKVIQVSCGFNHTAAIVEEDPSAG